MRTGENKMAVKGVESLVELSTKIVVKSPERFRTRYDKIPQPIQDHIEKEIKINEIKKILDDREKEYEESKAFRQHRTLGRAGFMGNTEEIQIARKIIKEDYPNMTFERPVYLDDEEDCCWIMWRWNI